MPLDEITPDQARSALADAERTGASAAALSATPWPTWFAACLTVYCAALPIAYGGTMAGQEWLLPQPVWAGVLFGLVVLFVVLLAVAARGWRERTGVALRFDVLPKRVTTPLVVALPVLVVGSGFVFRATGQAVWPVAAAVVAAAVSAGFHLVFVRLHRRPV